MAKYTSGRQKNLKIGISSYSENLTSLEVIGKVGIGTTNATSKLTVVGDVYISGISTLGITTATNLTAQSLVISGISTLGITSVTNLTSQSLVVSGISTLGITSATNLTAQSLFVSGIITATYYYGNGSNLTGIATTKNLTVGTRTTSVSISVVGTGMTVSLRSGIGTVNF